MIELLCKPDIKKLIHVLLLYAIHLYPGSRVLIFTVPGSRMYSTVNP